jgi:hypothetical protein
LPITDAPVGGHVLGVGEITEWAPGFFWLHNVLRIGWSVVPGRGRRATGRNSHSEVDQLPPNVRMPVRDAHRGVRLGEQAREPDTAQNGVNDNGEEHGDPVDRAQRTDHIHVCFSFDNNGLVPCVGLLSRPKRTGFVLCTQECCSVLGDSSAGLFLHEAGPWERT